MEYLILKVYLNNVSIKDAKVIADDISEILNNSGLTNSVELCDDEENVIE